MRMRSAASLSLASLGICAALVACGSGGSGSRANEPNGTGGSGGGSGTAGTGGKNPTPPPRVVANCDSLSDVGVWENVTPPFPMLPTAVAVDPINSGTVYFGTSPGSIENPSLGIWKTTDCGSTWVHINQGTESGLCAVEKVPCSTNLDHGRQWTFGIDPIDPKVIYVNNGYGMGDLGLMKSTDGGVNWWQMWPQCTDPYACYDTKNLPINDLAPGFLGDVVVDPYNHNHILIDFHAPCKNVEFCVGESYDAGATWQVVDGNPAMGSAHESRLGFLGDSQSWVFISGGIWRTLNGGRNWEKMDDGGGGGMIYEASTGVYYIGGVDAIFRSDNDGDSWMKLPETGPLIQGLVGDGTTIFASKFAAGFPWGENLQPYITTSDGDGLTWTTYPSPPFTQGAIAMGIDDGHHLLWSVNAEDGIWRVKFR
jgi:hypothetical protein